LRALGASRVQCERGLRSLPLIIVHGVDEQEAMALQIPLSKTGGLFRVWHTDDVTGYRNLSPRT
jgi:hypothetical protein